MTDMLIGTGRLTWARNERVSDRYGSVRLMRSGDSRSTNVEWLPLVIKPEHLNRPAQLTAVIIETRQSTHIGDLFRGIFPSTPAVGEVIKLGEGLLFAERDRDGDLVGLIPLDGRADSWLDVEALYRCHEQTVELYYTEAL